MSRSKKSVGFIRPIPARIIDVNGMWTRTCVVEGISAKSVEITIDASPNDPDFPGTSNEFYLVLSSGELPVYRHCEAVSITNNRITARLSGKPFTGIKATPETDDKTEPKQAPQQEPPRKGRLLRASVKRSRYARR